jgi:hypothetical protein
MVASVDLSSIIRKANVSGESVKDFVAEKWNVNLDDVQGLSMLLDEPAEIGLDWDAPLYVFQTVEGATWFVAKVYDSDAFTLFLDVLNKKGYSTQVKEDEAGLSTSVFSGVELFFDETTLLVSVPNAEASSTSIRNTAKELFRLEETVMFAGTDKYKQLMSKGADSDIAMFYKLRNQKGGLELMSSLTMHEDEISLNLQVDNADGKIKDFIDDLNKNTSLLSDRFIDAAYANPFLWMSMGGMDGDFLLDFLKSTPRLKTMLLALGRGIDIDMMLKSIKGDVVVSLADKIPLNPRDNQSYPGLCFLSELETSDFLDDVDYWLTSMQDYGMSMDCLGSDRYVLKSPNVTLAWGVQDGEMYMSTDKNFALDNKSGTAYLNEYRDVMSRNKLFAYVDLKAYEHDALWRNYILQACSLFNLGKPERLIVTSSTFMEYDVNLMFK